MIVNGKSITEYGAVMLGSPRVSPAPIEQDVFKGRNGSTFNVLNPRIGLKSIECSVAFLGESAYEIQIARSAFRASLAGKLELYFSFDGFYYTASLTGYNDVESESDKVEVTRLSFTGIQHGPLVTQNSTTVVCQSTIPNTSATFFGTATAEDGKIAGIAFKGLRSGDKIEVDGVNLRILVNDAPGASRFELYGFPTLSPGANVIDLQNVDQFYVQYFPTYA